jgi:anion-transporting  ArsA/GET3 family ATPase
VALSTSLHIVSGKGGTGKTTVAAALATALADAGKRVLLCEVEGRQGIAQLFDVPPLPYYERKIAVGLGGGEVYALAVDAESALLEYLQMYYRLGRAGKALDRFGIIDFATTIAPGVRDVLLTGKVYEAARRRNGSGFAYDAVIMDAPPTGRITRFLNVNAEVAGLAKVGPIRRQADSIMQMMRSDDTHVHLVTVLEEMPVQETIDGIDELQSERLPVGSVILNLVRPPLLSVGTWGKSAWQRRDSGAQTHMTGGQETAAFTMRHANAVDRDMKQKGYSAAIVERNWQLSESG